MDARRDLAAMAAEIVSSYVRANPTPPEALPNLIRSVYSALGGLTREPPPALPENLDPAVPVKRSITADYLVCLEDGKKFKSLKRHLRTRYALSPEEYRAKWGLPNDYPMVAPNYAKERSNLAKKMGLGQARKSDTGR